MRNARDIFQTCREKGVILSAKKLVIGMERVSFVGHEVDSQGLNMTEPKIASAIAFKTPESMKELMSFLGLVNYFRDHIRNNSTHVHRLHDMVSAVNKKIVKVVTWTSAGKAAFKTL